MSLKTFLGKKLVKIGRSLLEQKQRVSAATAYTAPIKITYHDGESIKHVGTHYLPFDERNSVQTHKSIQPVSSLQYKRTMPNSKEAPKNAKDLYRLCGGYDMFCKILCHANWYAVRQDVRDDGYTYTLRILNRNSKTKKGHIESKTMRVRSKQEGEAIAKQLVDIHALEIYKRQN